MNTTPHARTRVALAPIWYAGFAVVGAVLVGVLGLLFDPVSRWAAGQEWLPAGDLIRFLESASATAPSWLQAAIGAAVGVVAGLLVASQANAIEVSDDEVVVVDGSKRQRFARSQVGHAVLEGRRLSVRDHADADLLSTKVDGDVAQLRTALVEHGWSVRG